MSVLLYKHDDGIAEITLNNPPQNRLSTEVMAGLMGAIQDLSQRDDTRVLVVRAEGEDFGFGGDVQTWAGVSKEDFSAMIAQGLALANTFENLPFPVVFAIRGHCLGGAFEFALRGDIILAEEGAKFGHPEATVGVFTFLGGVQRVAERVGRTRAMEWALSAEWVDAQDAMEAGLINAVAPKGALETLTADWVRKLSRGATKAHVAHKRLLRAWSAGGIGAADDMMPEMAGDILHSKDAQGSLVGAIKAVKAGTERPAYPFEGK